MDAAFALLIATMLIVYLAVTGAISRAQARRFHLAARDAQFENDVREMEAFFWRKGLDHQLTPDLLADITRDCRALIAGIGTRSMDQLARQAGRVERSWMTRGGFTDTAVPRRRFSAPVHADGARAAE